MRLLNTQNWELKSFPNSAGYTPPYAILSHCWSENANDEVLYADVQNGTATSKKAYPKLLAAMQQARDWKGGSYDWIWCDTCCINKESSAELSEAINSMYTWYAGSEVCFAYLEDEQFDSPTQLQESKWFTRGWTLQELIAPKELIFYDKNWRRVGSKSFPAIRDMVVEKTGIPEEILTASGNLQSISIAQRMSWAAHRFTTRPEDKAYCLMGIFQVNMPMLYGEGADNAFHRLQEQIMKDSNDHSIFAWTGKDSARHGLLADSPDAFADRFNMIGYADWEDEQPFQPSNRGLRIHLHLTPAGDGTFYAALNCPIPSPERGYHGFTCIKLEKLASGVNQYARVQCHQVFGLEARSDRPSTVYVRQKTLTQEEDAVMPWHFFQPRELHFVADAYELLHVSHYPLEKADQRFAPRPTIKPWFAAAQASAFQIIKRAGRLSAVMYFRRMSDYAKLAVLFGSIGDMQVGFDLALVDETNLSINAIESTMRLKPPGTMMEAGTHKVCIESTVRIDVPRKLYMFDITIDGMYMGDMTFWDHRPAPINAQELVTEAIIDIVADVQGVATNDRIRPMSLLKRARMGVNRQR
ncbi:Putative heterokaryon incompatibility [Septoria linicola]|uniref:Heterokaryon incompatibility n=1 Tax=Septoria linicola TaxID=215465 RepID=A0A9Q9B133_9PEZI|nr:putative heterokaryon incompatibility [Septoria linicola]USW59029.1 Putative heterokaryon incompatibility [Septoria linicola]